MSDAYKRHDINSLKTVTYGTEPMPESTLKRFNHLFPDRIKKIYTPFATRLSAENLERLNKLKKTTGLTIQNLINSMIESYYLQNKPD